MATEQPNERRFRRVFATLDERDLGAFAEDDLVAFEGTTTGTHRGEFGHAHRDEFRGIEPTDETIEITGNAMHRIGDGRIAETWATWNLLEFFQQLGVVQPPWEDGMQTTPRDSGERSQRGSGTLDGKGGR